MAVRFYDREGSSADAIAFEDAASLLNYLQTLTARTPFFCELEDDRGFSLMIGLGNPWSCVQFSRTDGDLPYLVAVGRESAAGGQELEFVVGGTITPVSSHYRLAFDEVRLIVGDFVESGRPFGGVVWEEI